MKKWTWLLFIISFIMMLTGCTKDEVIHVGTPINGGIHFHKEVTDSEAIKILRKLVAEVEETDEPK